MQKVHQSESKEGQEKYNCVVQPGSASCYKIEMGINPPGLVAYEVKDEGTEPHPQGVKGHKEECLEDFHCVHVKSVINYDFNEHKDEREDVDRNIQENCDWT